jgi:hypothetical protein
MRECPESFAEPLSDLGLYDLFVYRGVGLNVMGKAV